MEWIIFTVVYLAIGIGVFVWFIRDNDTIASDQKKRSAKTLLIIFSGLCLFWPVVLFIEIKLTKAVRKIANSNNEE